jgi:uncharacterized heparinase superfamily protein
MTGEELALLGRTAAHLRPAQIAHRARLRAQAAALHRFPQAGERLLAGRPRGGPDPAAMPGWPADFRPLDATALTVTSPPHWPGLAELRAGQIRLLGVTRRLGDPPAPPLPRRRPGGTLPGGHRPPAPRLPADSFGADWAGANWASAEQIRAGWASEDSFRAGWASEDSFSTDWASANWASADWASADGASADWASANGASANRAGANRASANRAGAGRISADSFSADWTGPDWGGADWRPAAGRPPGSAAVDWQQPDAPQLWRFHLHYWDWAWGLAADPDRSAARDLFAVLWRSWRASCAFGAGDAWRPYPAALRAWSWCGLYRDLVAGTGLAGEFCRELAAHAGFLRRHLESDVGGNHLVKNLKALAGLAVFLGDEPLLRRSLRLLTGQLAVQVLPDGGHYERAPAYHCQVLADLIDVTDLLSAAGQVPAPALTLAIARMRRWLGAVLTPDGAVPLLNDGFPVPGALVAALRPAPVPPGPLVTLADTGLIRGAAGDWHLLADAGPACPDDLPAHAHADTLSCVAHVGGQPLLVDTGTSTYAAGPVRDYERSTAAHNTVEIDGADSTEVWGAFRAGRRARVYGPVARLAADGMTALAAHDGYRHLRGRPCHRRRWSLTSGGLQVDDEVTGEGRHEVALRWHLPPGAGVRLRPGGATVATAAGEFAVTVAGTAPFRMDVESAPVATGFQRTAAAPVVTCRLDAVLPVRLTTSWCRAGAADPSGGPA